MFFLVKVDSLVEGELPYDKLIVLMTNIIDFLIEYKETSEEYNSILIANVLNLFLVKILIIMKININFLIEKEF